MYLLRYLKGISNVLCSKLSSWFPPLPHTCFHSLLFLGKRQLHYSVCSSHRLRSHAWFPSFTSHTNPSVHPAGITFEIYPESKGILYFPTTTPELLPKPPNWSPGLHHCSVIAHSSHSSQNEAFKSKSHHLFLAQKHYWHLQFSSVTQSCPLK